MTYLSPQDRAKRAAGRRAAELVRDGQRVGLGTGTTVAFLLERLGERVREEGLAIRGAATSEATAAVARAQGIPVEELDALGWLDICIDGADEVDGNLDLIKGGGGALLREKIVATASERVVIAVDASKRVERLGRFPLPVEVVPWGWRATQGVIEEVLAGLDVDGRGVALRERDGATFATDGGHLILDLSLGRIGNPRQLAMTLNQVPGVVENGLFLGLCDALVTGFPDGRAEVRDPVDGTREREG